MDETSRPRTDGLVSCETVEDDAIREPVIVIEVLSPSTSGRDLTRKVALYERVASIRHYLAISQEEVFVYHFRRDETGRFQPRLVREGALDLDPPGVGLALDAVYAGVRFAAERPGGA